MRIIVVENDSELRSSLVRFLGILGYEAVAARSALEFYRMIDHSSFSLAIMDVGLPDQSGVVLVEYLRKNTMMHIVMMMTTNAIDDRLLCYQAGADILLEKPFDFRELSALLHNIFSRISNRTVPAKFLDNGSDGSHYRQKPVLDEPPSWRLMTEGWRLIAPAGDSVELTLKEFKFLTALSGSDTAAVSRQQLLKALEYQNDEYGNRALESLVHRLRSKVARLGSLPIKTAHGIGYSFAAQVIIM